MSFKQIISRFKRFWLTAASLLLISSSWLLVPPVAALGSQQNPQSGSVGLEGTVPAAPPSKAPTISVPTSGQTFTATPITVSGLCTSGLLVKVFSNNIFVGAANCANGSYSLQIDLFSGRNDLIARAYDALDQASPDSNTVTVTFNDAQFAQFGSHVSLSSQYAKMGVDPGKVLSWPIIISGGVGPYALSTDWGDGTAPTLQSVAFAGELNITHTYKSAGIYKVIVRATDANGTAAFLQLVGVANGKVSQSSSTGSQSGSTTIVNIPSIWWLSLLLVPLGISTFWLGRRHELFTLRKHIEQSREQVQYADQTADAAAQQDSQPPSAPAPPAPPTPAP